jgi:hypothetical protein
MVAAAHAAGLDMPGISAEAALAREAWPTGNRDVVDVIFAPPYTRPAIDAAHFDSQDKDALIAALGADSDWLATIACTYLLNTHDPQVGERAARRILEVAPNRRASAVMVTIANDPNPADAASRFLDDSDPTVRAGAASGTRMLARAGANGPWDVLLSRPLDDDDQAVRRAAGATPESYWSCDECGQANKIGVSRCSNCGDDKQLRIVTHRGDAG